MTLETYAAAADLYLARGEEVNSRRPFFTGDVFAHLPIPGVDGDGMGMIVAHPCSFRAGIVMSDRILVARVLPHSKEGPRAWTRGFADKMPLPDLAGEGTWAAHLDQIGRANVDDLRANTRIATLSEFGVNLLQHRTTYHLTRAEIPTTKFEEAFAHTFQEADLLEEFTDDLVEAGWTVDNAYATFEQVIRSGSPTTYQEMLKEPQLRSSVRRAVRDAAKRLKADQGVEW